MDKTGDNSPRACLFAEVYLLVYRFSIGGTNACNVSYLDVEAVCVRMFLDYKQMSAYGTEVKGQ